MEMVRRLIFLSIIIKCFAFLLVTPMNTVSGGNPTINLTTQNDTKWYWAFIEHYHQIIAYNITGEFNVLINDGQPSSLYRIDERTAVITIERNDAFSTYILTSENAYFISTFHVVTNSDDYGQVAPPNVKALALTFPYILLWDHGYTAPFLFNRETHAVETLNLGAWETVRLSDDGRYLRYWIRDNVDAERRVHWRLIEYDVLNTTTRIIFERDRQADIEVSSIGEHCEPDTYGEKWFCIQSTLFHNALRPLTQNEIIHLDGEIESIDADQHLKIGLNGDWFFVSSAFYGNYCDATCSFEVTDYAVGEIQRYALSSVHIPDGVTFALNYSKILDAQHLLLFDVNDDAGGTTLYLLENKGTTLHYLGLIPCCHLQSGSADGQWAILYDLQDKDEPSTVLVDLRSGRIVLREGGLIDMIGFTSDGAYVGGTTFYSTETDLVFKLDEGLYPGLIIEVLGSGRAIGAWAYGSESAPNGIYATDASQGRRLLIPDAQPIHNPFARSLQ